MSSASLLLCAFFWRLPDLRPCPLLLRVGFGEMLIAVLWLLLRDPRGLPESLELFNAGNILQSRRWAGLLVQSTSAIKLRVVLGVVLGAGLDHAIRPAQHKDVVEHRNGNSANAW